MAAGHDDETFRERADGILRRALNFDVAAWSTTDPGSGLLTSCHVLGLPYDANQERLLFRYEYETDGEVGARYTELARAAVPAAALTITTGGNLRASIRHRELLEPLGIVDELRVAFVTGGVSWGTLTAYRYEGKAPSTNAMFAPQRLPHPPLPWVFAEASFIGLVPTPWERSSWRTRRAA